jgi:hypothetical protein
MSNSESLIEHWRDFDPVAGRPYVHPKDVEWMQSNWPDALKGKLYESWSSYTAGERFGMQDNLLHLSLVPVPYAGDLENAEIVIFLTNGGFGDADYFFEDYLGVRQSLLDNLHQKPGREFPFFCLNPDLAWSGPFRWWEPKLRPIIKLLIGNNMSYTSALKVLAKKIAVVELFPYHSRNSAKLKGVNEPNLMPSVRKAREFLALESHNDKRLKLLMRRHNDWSSSSCAPESAHFVYGPRKTQSIWLNPGLPGPNGDAGRAIKRKLGIA